MHTSLRPILRRLATTHNAADGLRTTDRQISSFGDQNAFLWILWCDTWLFFYIYLSLFLLSILYPSKLSFTTILQSIEKSRTQCHEPTPVLIVAKLFFSSSSLVPQFMRFGAKRQYDLKFGLVWWPAYVGVAVVLGCSSFVVHHKVSGSNMSRTVWPGIIKFHTDIHTDLL